MARLACYGHPENIVLAIHDDGICTGSHANEWHTACCMNQSSSENGRDEQYLLSLLYGRQWSWRRRLLLQSCHAECQSWGRLCSEQYEFPRSWQWLNYRLMIQLKIKQKSVLSRVDSTMLLQSFSLRVPARTMTSTVDWRGVILGRSSCSFRGDY